MKYPNIISARFIRRPNRFLAEVELNGRAEMVHVKNTGRCRELLLPGSEVYLTEPDSSGRKTRFDLVAVRKENGILFNIDSQAPNKAAMEWLTQKGYDRVLPEYTYGDSRIDFYMERILEDGSTERHLMEVKGCTLEIDGVGYFPDAPTERGVKHLRELAGAAQNGYRTHLAFVIQMDGVEKVLPNTNTHPQFAEALQEAQAAGVQVIYLQCHVEPDSLIVVREAAAAAP